MTPPLTAPKAPTPAAVSGTATAPLLYWLLVVCGLAGLSLMRTDTPDDLIPIWAGTIAGVALGQFVAWLRVRAWLLGVMALGGFWFAPVAFFVLYSSFGGGVQTCVLAFLPAAICGYLSLSERGGLVAFWYPAVLWMLVILDGPVAGQFDTRTALPFLVGLGGLFVAFLRARETRRVAVWRAEGSDRLAKALPRTVLRASPLRAASQLAWTGLVGAGALVLAAWIAPHLWQKEQAKHANVVSAREAANDAAMEAALNPEPPCCGVPEPTTRVRVSEYFAALNGHEERDPTLPLGRSCNRLCRDDAPTPTASESESHAGSGSGAPPMYQGEPAKGGGADTPPLPPAAAEVPPPVVQPKAQPKPVDPAIVHAGPSSPHGPRKPGVVIVYSKPAAPIDTGAPWRLALTLCLGGLGLHVVARALRRSLTLRHLARPFWSETLDQRISNHWQRMLIGLRDAGIIPKAGEQPLALAKRVGIEGMETCATILERVRHGVRVDTTDLDSMNSAADAVYRTARAKAGVSGRTAAVLRWPLA